jgi:hypothetical protein
MNKYEGLGYFPIIRKVSTMNVNEILMLTEAADDMDIEI